MPADSLSIKTWTIYKIVSPENSVYMGKTADYDRRKKQHSKINNQHNKLLKESIIRYGWEAHNIQPIDIFDSMSSYAEDKEMFWIRTYMSNRMKWPEMKGFNLTSGAYGHHGYIPSAETRQKQSLLKKGKPSHFKGKKRGERSDLLNAKYMKVLSIALGKRITEIDVNGETLREFNSIAEALRFHSIPRQALMTKLKGGKSKKAKYLYFKYS